MKVFLLSIVTGTILFGLFTYNYSNYQQAIQIDLNSQSEAYQRMLNKQLEEKLLKEHIEEEKKILKQVSTTLKIYSIKLNKQNDISVCSTLSEPLDKVPDPVYTENQLEKEKISQLHIDLRKTCNHIRLVEFKKKQLEEKEKQQLLLKQVASDVMSRIPTSKQSYNSNTCVIDNLNLLFEFEYGKKIDTQRIYRDMGKKVGDFWHSGLFAISQYGGTFTPVEANTLAIDNNTQTIFYLKNKDKYSNYEVIDERKDWVKLESITGLKTGLSSSIWYLKEVLNTKKPVLIELPMSVLYPNDERWKSEKNSSIYHAISVFWYNSDTNELVYSNTLSGKIETINLNKLKYNETYLLYPFRYTTMFEPSDFKYYK